MCLYVIRNYILYELIKNTSIIHIGGFMSVALLTEYVSPQVLNEVSKLDKEKQEKLINLFLSQKKNKGLAIGLSVVGLHYAYLQKWGLFVLYGITGGGFLIWLRIPV